MRSLVVLLITVSLFVCVAPANAEQPTARVLTLEQWQWVHRWFPERELSMARTTWCESNFRDEMVGANGEIGRLQIMPIHAWRLGFTPSDLHDPEINGYIGSLILAERPDGSAWTLYNGCKEWDYGS